MTQNILGNTPGLHHVGHTSDLNTPHKYQGFTLQTSKANSSLQLEVKQNALSLLNQTS